MGFKLLFLEFKPPHNGDGTHTLEAVASAPPARVDAALAEVACVLAWAHRGAQGE